MFILVAQSYIEEWPEAVGDALVKLLRRGDDVRVFDLDRDPWRRQDETIKDPAAQ